MADREVRERGGGGCPNAVCNLFLHVISQNAADKNRKGLGRP